MDTLLSQVSRCHYAAAPIMCDALAHNKLKEIMAEPQQLRLNLYILAIRVGQCPWALDLGFGLT